MDLACLALDALPAEPEAWRPNGGAPPELEPLLGRWWSEGSRRLLGARRPLPGPPGRHRLGVTCPGSSPTATTAGGSRGRELGEVLRVVRGEDGCRCEVYLATYPLTREPATFA